jgi:hypothetical protein
MRRLFALVLFALPLLLARPAQAQEWRPPSRQMPAMPRIAELQGDWLTPRQAWFRGVEAIAGVAPSRLRAQGEPRSGSGFLHIVRFSDGPVPVVVWSDIDADSRADMVEIFRRGGVIIQLIDADRDGSANVLRVYDASGALVREDPM